MKQSITTRTFELEDREGYTVEVTAEITINRVPLRIEECHGPHQFDDSDVVVVLTSIVDDFGFHVEGEYTPDEVKEFEKMIADKF